MNYFFYSVKSQIFYYKVFLFIYIRKKLTEGPFVGRRELPVIEICNFTVPHFRLANMLATFKALGYLHKKRDV